LKNKTLILWIVVGFAIGYLFDNAPIGTVIGLVVGLVRGRQKAKKDGSAKSVPK
jgi:hypothetical protein